MRAGLILLRPLATVTVAAVLVGPLAWPSAAGARWVRQPAGADAVHLHGSLSGISCRSGRDCLAVGHSMGPAGSQTTLAERWDGSRWSVLPSPNRASTRNQLLSVSCGSPNTCTAVGASGHGTSPLPALEIQRWDGSSWALQSAPLPANAHQSSLAAVSCPSAADCTAVGYYVTVADTRQRTLVEHWDGTRWKIQATPSGGALASVSCVSVTFCLAIGNQLERWDGHRWRVVRTLADGGWNAVSCSSPRACMAVGDDARALRWTGSRWLTVRLPPTRPAFYEGISCLSAVNCTAVGESSQLNTRAAWWDGRAWRLQATPALVRQHSALASVSCPAPSACTAVGYAGPRPLVERRSQASGQSRSP